MVLDVRRLVLLARVAWPVILAWTAQALNPARQVAGLGAQLRSALEVLGLTYVKLGQFLAMRFDVLPAEICNELSNLFENADPVPWEEVVRLVESELQAPLSKLFAAFDPQPIAAASIAQVHEARTHAGLRVAVKVQRPGAQQLFEADMRNLLRLARLADRLGLGGVASVREMVAEFETWTRQEFDFILEGRNAERLRGRATPFELIPAVYWPLTTKRVLTMDFVEGVSAARVAALRRSASTAESISELLPNYDPDLAMHRLAEASLKHIFVDGRYHADIHPGNVFIREDNGIALLDFGITGELTSQRRALLAAYYETLATGRIDECLRYYVQLWVYTPESDVRGFVEEMKPIIWDYYRNATDPQASLASAHWGRVTNETLLVARRHRVRSSLDLLLFFRAVGTMHTTMILLGADFFAELRSFLLQRRGTRIREEVSAALTSEVATSIRDRWQTELQLARLLSRVRDHPLPGMARTRFREVGYRARSGTVAMFTLSLVIALSGQRSHSLMNVVAIGGGALMLAMMIGRLWRTRRYSL